MTESKTSKCTHNIIKIIIFFIILFYITNYTFSILWLDRNSTSYFFEEQKNSMDIVYIGTSNAYVAFNTTLAYNLYGFTTGMLASGAQPFTAIEYLIKESKKYQEPTLYIIDLTSIGADPRAFSTEYIRKCVDAMKFSKNRINTINKLLSYTSVDKKEYINYYFSFFMYHTKWKNLEESSWRTNELYKGYLFNSNSILTVPNVEYTWTQNSIELPEENKQILMNLIEYIKDNQLNVLFTVPVRYFNDERIKEMNDAVSIIEENGFEVINFNTLDDFTTNLDTDFYDRAHLNVCGATKFTLYFAKYLKEHYDLKNHKGNSKYASWEKEYERFKENYRKLTNKNFDNLLLQYQEDL